MAKGKLKVAVAPTPKFVFWFGRLLFSADENKKRFDVFRFLARGVPRIQRCRKYSANKHQGLSVRLSARGSCVPVVRLHLLASETEDSYFGLGGVKG